jgi:hypothetical protein
MRPGSVDVAHGRPSLGTLAAATLMCPLYRIFVAVGIDPLLFS